jgi:hypothetical protein
MSHEGERLGGAMDGFGCLGRRDRRTFPGFFFLVGAGYGQSQFDGCFFVTTVVGSAVVLGWAFGSLEKMIRRRDPSGASLDDVEPGAPPAPRPERGSGGGR